MGPPANWTYDGGTSLSSPIMAGIQAMVNQAVGGERQGNPNFIYYLLAGFEYNFGENVNCDSTLGNQTSPRCVFYDITLGDNDVNCLPLSGVGTFNCYFDGGTNGVLSRSNSAYEPTYVATPGYDYPTGIGTVNAYNLARSWPGSLLH